MRKTALGIFLLLYSVCFSDTLTLDPTTATVAETLAFDQAVRAIFDQSGFGLLVRDPFDQNDANAIIRNEVRRSIFITVAIEDPNIVADPKVLIYLNTPLPSHAGRPQLNITRTLVTKRLEDLANEGGVTFDLIVHATPTLAIQQPYIVALLGYLISTEIVMSDPHFYSLRLTPSISGQDTYLFSTGLPTRWWFLSTNNSSGTQTITKNYDSLVILQQPDGSNTSTITSEPIRFGITANDIFRLGVGVYVTNFFGFMDPSDLTSLEQPVTTAAEQIVQKNILINQNEQAQTVIDNQQTLQFPAGKTVATLISNQLGIYMLIPELATRIRANQSLINLASQQIALLNTQEQALFNQSTRMILDAIQLLIGFQPTFVQLNALSGAGLLVAFNNLVELENTILTMQHMTDRLIYINEHEDVQGLFTKRALAIIEENLPLIETMKTLSDSVMHNLDLALYNSLIQLSRRTSN